jgi:monoamine oxidase
MALPELEHIVVVGAGAAGLMAARELSRAGKRVTILEARDRCGGRIQALPVEEFGYPAEGGAEFVHGAARVTRAVMRDARLSLLSRGGTRWRIRGGRFLPDEGPLPHAAQFYQILGEVTADLPIARFLEIHFGGPQYDELRRRITRTVEGYDAADPHRASTIALREEWLAGEEGEHGRIAEGYGALIDYLASECRKHGARLVFGAAVTSIEERRTGLAIGCRGGAVFAADAAILTVPLPILSEIVLPPAARERAAAVAEIGYGNVVKLLFRFASNWWARHDQRQLAELAFLLSDATVPTWWTQYPATYPVLTGWYAGPKADRVASLTESELIDMGIASLEDIFGLKPGRVRQELAAARAINWGNDPFARGAYSYATPGTREAQSALRQPVAGTLFFSGEAFYDGPDIGTVEAALAIGQETARSILAGG